VIEAELNQSALTGGQRLPRRDLDRALRACDRALRPARPASLSVAFVDEREMRRLNKEWRGRDKVTDVLSFEDVGEILICYPQARRQAAELGHSARDEVIFLLVHGVLHVFGYDHVKPADAKRMFPLQAKILTSLGVDPRL
jgi:probable rRNA maturation factor